MYPTDQVCQQGSPSSSSPHAGAATGSGGEIRDEAATRIGGEPKAGLCGCSVSNLHIAGFEQSWEQDFGRPSRIASALDIMFEGPIGAAAFNNEFGRPNIAGYSSRDDWAVSGAVRCCGAGRREQRDGRAAARWGRRGV